MLSKRNVERFSGRILEFESVGDYFSQPVDGEFITISYGDSYLDLLCLDRGFHTTVVAFHPAVSQRPSTVLPIFYGVEAIADLPMNLVSISDPALYCGVEMGWFAGTRSQHLQRDLAPILRHVMEGSADRDLVFMGSSSGGFAALYYSYQFPGSKVLAINPQLNLRLYNESVTSSYAKNGWGVELIDEVPATTDLGEVYRNGFPNEVFLIQNITDGHHRDLQLARWLRKVPAESPKFNLLMKSWGKGHKPIPHDELVSILRAIPQDRGNARENVGFVNAPPKDWPLRKLHDFQQGK